MNDVAASAREGLHGIAAGPDGVVWAVWLDLREKGMRLMGSLSTDAGKTWSPNQLVYASPDGHICECCHPTAYIGPKGELYAMWRNWLSGSRDMYYAVSTDRKTWSAHKLGEGTWPLKACPMDGGGLALDGKGGFHSAWRRDGVVYAAPANGKEVALGPAKNPSIAANRNGRVCRMDGRNSSKVDEARRYFSGDGRRRSISGPRSLGHRVHCMGA